MPDPGDAFTPAASFECGEEPVGNARIQFNIRFYVFALIFIVFVLRPRRPLVAGSGPAPEACRECADGS